MENVILREEQTETAREVAGILRLSQEMGQRLARETHGDLYDDVLELNHLLHQARNRAESIRQKLTPFH